MAGVDRADAAPAAGPAVSPPGLTSAEVAERRLDGRGNEVEIATSRPLSVIVRTNVFTRFNAILGVLLAVIIVVGPFQDALFAFVLVLNTLIGVGQEVRAKRTLDRLALISAPRVRVWRDGSVVETAVRDLVVDDEVDVARGDQIPLDGVVLDGVLELDESLLTGESDPVTREAGDEVYSGSFVSSGTGGYRVTRVGTESFAQRLVGEARRFAPARWRAPTMVRFCAGATRPNTDRSSTSRPSSSSPSVDASTGRSAPGTPTSGSPWARVARRRAPSRSWCSSTTSSPPCPR